MWLGHVSVAVGAARLSCRRSRALSNSNFWHTVKNWRSTKLMVDGKDNDSTTQEFDTTQQQQHSGSLIPSAHELVQFPQQTNENWMDTIEKHTGGVLGKIEIEHISSTSLDTKRVQHSVDKSAKKQDQIRAQVQHLAKAVFDTRQAMMRLSITSLLPLSVPALKAHGLHVPPHRHHPLILSHLVLRRPPAEAALQDIVSAILQRTTKPSSSSSSQQQSRPQSPQLKRAIQQCLLNVTNSVNRGRFVDVMTMLPTPYPMTPPIHAIITARSVAFTTACASDSLLDLAQAIQHAILLPLLITPPQSLHHSSNTDTSTVTVVCANISSTIPAHSRDVILSGIALLRLANILSGSVPDEEPKVAEKGNDDDIAVDDDNAVEQQVPPPQQQQQQQGKRQTQQQKNSENNTLNSNNNDNNKHEASLNDIADKTNNDDVADDDDDDDNVRANKRLWREFKQGLGQGSVTGQSQEERRGARAVSKMLRYMVNANIGLIIVSATAHVSL